jgi:uncharacterized membrane protein
LPRRYAVRALAVVVCWAVKFVVVDVGLEAFPPLLFAAQRFGLTVFPAIFAGQFGLLSVAMNTGLPAGLASVVAPLQPVFTIPLAVVVLGERPTVRQVALVWLAIAGSRTRCRVGATWLRECRDQSGGRRATQSRRPPPSPCSCRSSGSSPHGWCGANCSGPSLP